MGQVLSSGAGLGDGGGGIELDLVGLFGDSGDSPPGCASIDPPGSLDPAASDLPTPLLGLS